MVILDYKGKTPHKWGFSTLELRRGRDSNPLRGYKPLTRLAGERLSIISYQVAYIDQGYAMI